MTLWTAFVLIYAVAVLVSIWGGLSVRSFLARYPTITDRPALDAFKRLARSNMYMALMQIVILGAGFLVGILLVFRHGAIKGLGPVLVANGVVMGLGKLIKSLEVRARSLPCATQALGDEHARVSESWVHKPFPDF